MNNSVSRNQRVHHKVRRWALRIGVSVVLSACTLAAAARVQAAAKDVIVLGAASLSDVLPKVAQLWKGHGHAPIAFSFDSSSRLALQIEEGAPAGVYISADTDWMNYLQSRGRIEPKSRVELLHNALALIAPVNSTVSIHAAADLKTATFSHLALAGENVPAGKYADAALRRLGLWHAVASRVVRAGNVRGALEWVARGDAELGIVYTTDARVTKAVKIVYVFPESSHPPIVYCAALLKNASPQAKAFLDFCQSAAAGQVFKEAGFRLPKAIFGTIPAKPK